MITKNRMTGARLQRSTDRRWHREIHIRHPQRNDIRPAKNQLPVIILLRAGIGARYRLIKVELAQAKALRSQMVTSERVC